MTLIDGLVALGVILGFFYIIYTSMAKKNPQMIDKTKEWFENKPKEKIKEPLDKMLQVYDEKRSIM